MKSMVTVPLAAFSVLSWGRHVSQAGLANSVISIYWLGHRNMQDYMTKVLYW
jgi:hypothetical protein